MRHLATILLLLLLPTASRGQVTQFLAGQAGACPDSLVRGADDTLRLYCGGNLVGQAPVGGGGGTTLAINGLATSGDTVLLGAPLDRTTEIDAAGFPFQVVDTADVAFGGPDSRLTMRVKANHRGNQGGWGHIEIGARKTTDANVALLQTQVASFTSQPGIRLYAGDSVQSSSTNHGFISLGSGGRVSIEERRSNGDGHLLSNPTTSQWQESWGSSAATGGEALILNRVQDYGGSFPRLLKIYTFGRSTGPWAPDPSPQPFMEMVNDTVTRIGISGGSSLGRDTSQVTFGMAGPTFGAPGYMQFQARRYSFEAKRGGVYLPDVTTDTATRSLVVDPATGWWYLRNISGSGGGGGANIYNSDGTVDDHRTVVVDSSLFFFYNFGPGAGMAFEPSGSNPEWYAFADGTQLGVNPERVSVVADSFQINDHSLPAASPGYVWTLKASTGVGHWAPASGGGGCCSCDSLYAAQVGNFTGIILYDTCAGTRDTVLLASDQVIGMQAEAAADTVLAVYFNYIPVDVTGQASIVTPPASPQAGDWFAVADSRGNAASNNITVDFTGVTQRYYGQQTDDVLSTNGATVKYIYVDANVGWIRESR